MTRVFICSPYAGDIEKNKRITLDLCRRAVMQGMAPFAPHLLYPQFLDDEGVSRETGIKLGLVFMAICDLVWVYGAVAPTSGMIDEIERAMWLKIRIEVIDGPLILNPGIRLESEGG